MNIDKPKHTLAMARACVGTQALAAATGVSIQTINATLREQTFVRPILRRLPTPWLWTRERFCPPPENKESWTQNSRAKMRRILNVQ